MDKKIKKIQTQNRKVSRELKGLLKEDIKHDKKLDKCDNMMKNRK